MALDSVIRWQLVRDVIVHKKSGMFVLQTGTNYLNWTVENGNLVCISSTFPEASFTNFIQKKKLTESTIFLKAQSQIDPSRSLGFLLIRQHILDQEEFSKLVVEHWIFCTDYLFDPCAHLFWSTNSGILKPDFVRCDRPLAEVIIKTNRDSITVPTALRTVQELKPPYRIHAKTDDHFRFNEEERRVWMYLQSGSNLKQILQDPDVARIPCYKTLFLLWLSGYISDSRKPTPPPAQIVHTNILQKIPPEWIFPLCAGALIGVLLAPSSPPKPLTPQPAKVEPLNETLQKPAWSSDQTNEEPEDFNAETQGRRDENK